MSEQLSTNQLAELQTEAIVIDSCFDLARDMGLGYEVALDVACRDEVVQPAMAIEGDIYFKISEGVAQLLQQSEIGELPITSR